MTVLLIVLCLILRILFHFLWHSWDKAKNWLFNFHIGRLNKLVRNLSRNPKLLSPPSLCPDVSFSCRWLLRLCLDVSIPASWAPVPVFQPASVSGSGDEEDEERKQSSSSAPDEAEESGGDSDPQPPIPAVSQLETLAYLNAAAEGRLPKDEYSKLPIPDFRPESIVLKRDGKVFTVPLAATNERVETLRNLLAYPLAPGYLDIPDEKGWTALSHAVSRCEIRKAMALVRAGADLTVRTPVRPPRHLSISPCVFIHFQSIVFEFTVFVFPSPVPFLSRFPERRRPFAALHELSSWEDGSTPPGTRISLGGTLQTGPKRIFVSRHTDSLMSRLFWSAVC